LSALRFLSPAGAADAKGFHPVARSSMHRRQQEAGATFEERGGWLVPVALPNEVASLEHVGVADLSHLTKLEVRPAGAPATGRAVTWYPLSKRRALCFCHAPELPDVTEQLRDRLVLDVTAALSLLVIVGPEADTVMRRLTHLHHFPSSGEVAHLNAHVLKPAGAYWIAFPQEFGHYLWAVVVDRAVALGGGPIGVDALPEGALP
jgi:glycine cleavage system aminomethyltransferase T